MTKNRTNIETRAKRPMSVPYGIGSWIVLITLTLLLMASIAIGYLGWTSTNIDVPASGYVALAMGAIFSLFVGVGLMALVFYSSRRGYDEPAMLIESRNPAQDEAQTNSDRA